MENYLDFIHFCTYQEQIVSNRNIYLLIKETVRRIRVLNLFWGGHSGRVFGTYLVNQYHN
jgi:hypothetical protein